MSSWEKIFSDENLVRINIVKDILSEKGINAIVINKKDSSYNAFGQHEIHVIREEVLRALKIISDEIKFE